jgi:ABC-type antimicrobial peptide transport system permease subunit
MVAVVRTASAPEVLARNLLHIAKAIDPRIVPDVRTIRSFVNESLDSKKDTALTAGVLAILALLLACLGIMGLVAYTVSQRAKELAIRLALGAKPAQILAVVLRQLSLPVLAGLLLGLAGAAALSRLLDSLLFGIGRLDPAAYLGAIVFFAVSVALACVGPARRALRLDPARVLRSD